MNVRVCDEVGASQVSRMCIKSTQTNTVCDSVLEKKNWSLWPIASAHRVRRLAWFSLKQKNEAETRERLKHEREDGWLKKADGWKF